jgi:hypothetical protein
MDTSSLARLVNPCDTALFIEEIWGRASHLFPQSVGASARELMDVASLELLLATLNRADEGWLHLARGGRKSIPAAMLDAQGMLDLRKVRFALADGETLYLTKAERVSLPLMRLCRGVESELLAHGFAFREPVGAHVFLTPPESQGFPLHRDEHGSFVIQLEGSKHWTVYEPLADDAGPPRAGAVDPQAAATMGKETFELQSGDVLYLPEWWPHEARASTAHSLHVTIRLFPLRWTDVMLDVCREHPALAAAVPHGTARPAAVLADRLTELLRADSFTIPMPALLSTLSRRHSVPRTMLPDDGLRQVLELGEIDLDTRLVRSAGATCTVSTSGEQVWLDFPGGTIQGPAAFQPVFEFVARRAELRPRELPAVSGISYDRIDTARTLVRDGLLRAVRQSR